ncbi:MAG: hypothetical protein ACRDKB_09015 [Actinomycetota bacterium]
MAALTGVVFVVLLVVSFIVSGETPEADASSQEIISFYSENEAEITVSSILFGLGAVFFLFFNGTLRSVLRSAEGGTGTLSAVVYAGGVVATVGMLIFAGLGFTLGDTAGELEPAAAQALNALSSDFFLPLAGGIATFLFAAGLVTIRTGALPRWLGWVAIVLAIVEFSPIGFFVFLATLLWVLVVSILLVLGGEKAPAEMA